MEAGSFSAFPLNTGNRQEGGALYPEPGLSKRELFAAMAMQGFLSGNTEVLLSEEPKDSNKDMFDSCREVIIRDSVAYADALLAALNGGE